MSVDAPIFPDLAAEQGQLTHARACRDSMIARLRAVNPDSAADEITKQYVEMTVGDALEDLQQPGAGDFFGRIDEAAPSSDRWYVGRRHIEDDAHDPVVVDWRAPIAAPFYRATVHDPLGLRFRRRFTLADGELIAYLDEALDDPDGANVAAGIPDPVLAEIGAARTGAMREIVATIQAEQDVVIRAPAEGALIVQGGPGTGKTAVGLHRAAYLLFEHRRRLAREGVLVVGPNKVFLDYIGNVLPSLGERSVRQVTIADLAVPQVEITGRDSTDDARWKGHADRLDDLREIALSFITPPTDDLRVPIGARTLVIPAADLQQWIATALDGNAPLKRRREGLTALAQREVLRRTGREDAWGKATLLKSALTKAWPSINPVKVVERLVPKGRGARKWTIADQLLIDEANSLINGPPFTYGHVVVDEAQDHSAVALRAIGRRCPSGSYTILGDLAQSTTPAGQEDWAVVRRHLGLTDGDGQTAELTIGYRVPAPILDVANRLLPLTGVTVGASRSVRVAGEPPAVVRVSPGRLAATVADVVAEHRRHDPLTGIVAPLNLHEPIGAAMANVGLTAVSRVQGLAPGEVAIFEPEAVKGLEFDAVVVVNPHEILDGTARGARLLYVAMTRAVQLLSFVTDAEIPDVIRS